LKIKHADVDHIGRDGFGAAMVGHRDASPEHRKLNPFLPSEGMSRAVNATLDFAAGNGEVELAFHDLTLIAETLLAIFRYPTGFPLTYNTASLRERLREFQDYYDPGRSNLNMRNVLLVGHSMGGLLSSMQIRDSGDAISNKHFTVPIDELRE
jgi:hypothetical protein